MYGWALENFRKGLQVVVENNKHDSEKWKWRQKRI